MTPTKGIEMTTIVILILLVGIFIGATGALGTVIIIDNRDKNRKALQTIVHRQAKAYQKEFGGTLEAAEEIIRTHLPE